jgi:hypothetical protein
LSDLQTPPIEPDPVKEEEAVARGEALGFTHRGVGEAKPLERATRRKRPPPPPTETLYIRAPKSWQIGSSITPKAEAIGPCGSRFRISELVEGRGWAKLGSINGEGNGRRQPAVAL